MGLEQRKFEPAEEEAPERQEELPTPEKRTGKVIEFPKRPDDGMTELQRDDADREKAAKLGDLRGKILQFPGPQNEEALKPKGPEDDDDKTRRFSEGFEKYKVCDACHGSGKRSFFRKCPVCKGMGRVVESSWSKEGEMQIK